MPDVQALAASSFCPAPSPWLNPLQAAAYLGLSTGTLSVWRCVDGQNARRDISPKGPPYSLAGTQIRYNIVDLDVWMRKSKPRRRVAANVGRPIGSKRRKRATR
jgi:hypothetical protein